MSSFKPGDWIKSTRYPNLRPVQIISIYESNTRPGILGLKSKGTVLYSDEVELWKPKVGEWCWFWNQSDINLSISPHIGQYGNLSYSLEFYDNCEPFIGQLPTFIKDQS